MPVERFTFVASGYGSVIDAYKSIADEAAKTEKKTSRSFRKQAGAVKSSATSQEKDLARSLARREKMEDRLHARVSKTREREARKAANTQIREAKRVANAEERAIKRVAASRRKTLGRVGGAMGGAALRGIAAVGAAGALVMGAAARKTLALRDQSIGLAVQGGNPRDAARIQKQLQNTAIATPGAKAADIGAGVGAFVSKTGDLEKAMAFSGIMAEISVASGTAAEDVGGAMADMFEKFNITSVEDMSKAMADLYVQGKRGAFELKDAAAQFPKIAAAASKFGLGGKRGLATLGGLTQLAKRSTGSGEEAGTAVENMFAEMVKKSDLIKKKTGTDVFKDKGKTQTNDIVDILVGTISGAKGNQKTMLDIFGVRGSRAVSSSVSTYNRAYANASGTEEEKTATAIAALRAEITKAIDATGSEAEVKRDLAAMQEQTGAQLTAAWESISASIATSATPAMAALAKTMSEMVRNTDFDGVSKGLMALVEAAGLAAKALGWLVPEKKVDPVADAMKKKTDAEAALSGLGLDAGQRKALGEIAQLENVADMGGGMDPADLASRLKTAGVTPEQYASYTKNTNQLNAATDVAFAGDPTRRQALDKLTATGMDAKDAIARITETQADPSSAFEPSNIDIPLVGRIGVGVGPTAGASKEQEAIIQSFASSLGTASAKQGEATIALGTFTEAAREAAIELSKVKGKPSLFGSLFE